VIRGACILITAVAAGSAAAGIYLGAITLFGVALAIAVAASIVADLFSIHTPTAPSHGEEPPCPTTTTSQ